TPREQYGRIRLPLSFALAILHEAVERHVKLYDAVCVDSDRQQLLPQKRAMAQYEIRTAHAPVIDRKRQSLAPRIRVRPDPGVGRENERHAKYTGYHERGPEQIALASAQHTIRSEPEQIAQHLKKDACPSERLHDQPAVAIEHDRR